VRGPTGSRGRTTNDKLAAAHHARRASEPSTHLLDSHVLPRAAAVVDGKHIQAVVRAHHGRVAGGAEHRAAKVTRRLVAAEVKGLQLPPALLLVEHNLQRASSVPRAQVSSPCSTHARMHLRLLAGPLSPTRTLQSPPAAQMLPPQASARGAHVCCSSLAYAGAWPSCAGKLNLNRLPSACADTISPPLLLPASAST
jgi:hypothetical protein